MERILVVLNTMKPDLCTLEFACYVAGITHTKITALLGERMKESVAPVQKELFALPYVETVVACDVPGNQKILKSADDSEKWFSEACSNRNINCRILDNLEMTVADVIKESRFADLLIVNPETSIPLKNEGSPTHFVKEVLSTAECPVVLSPYSFDGISELAFLYDRSGDSVFAIKQFMHIFPGLNTKPVKPHLCDLSD